MSPEQHAFHRERIGIRSYETDPRGRLHAPILCQLLQKAATAHADLLGMSVGSLIDRGVAWVLTRLRLAVERWPGADEEIVITTWPEAMSRLLIERRFELRGAGDLSIGSASTLWIVLDLERRRPQRLPGSITGRMGELGIESEPARPPDLQAPSAADRELRFTVRRSDLDLAGHVNNTSYVGWAIEAVHDDVWGSCDLSLLDIRYLSECRHGQTVVSRCETSAGEDGSECRHQILREEDGAEAARARTVWHPRDS